MKTHTEQAFLEWAATRGVILDPRWPYPRHAFLRLNVDAPLEGCWRTPEQPESRPYFLWLLLESMRPWKSCFVWRAYGSWPDVPHPDDAAKETEFQILAGLGMPMSTADVVEFSADETGKLLTVMFCATIFAWCPTGDLYVVPDTGLYLLHTSHHGFIDMEFRDQAHLDPFEQALAKVGFPLVPPAVQPQFKPGFPP